MKIFVSIYASVDAFPPTLNLINYLVENGHTLTVLEMSDLATELPDSLQSYLVKPAETPGVTRKPKFNNYLTYFRFLKQHRSILQAQSFDLVVAYDCYALLANRVVKPRRRKLPIWYHNHDVAKFHNFTILSLGWFAHLFESRLVCRSNYFSLPSIERQAYYPKRKIDFLLPNYPALKIYQKLKSAIPSNGQPLELIFQGRVTNSHSLDKFIEIINDPDTIDIRLTLKGRISSVFKNEIISSCRYPEKIKFIGYTSYSELPKVTSSCHVGIAIFHPDSYMRATLGTASNKIYEYAACGLPILYLDTPHFKKYLRNYVWAHPVNNNVKDILFALNKIRNNYDQFSTAAKGSFEKDLNFELMASNALTHIDQTMS